MKKVYATIIRNKQVVKTSRISKELLDEFLADREHYILKDFDKLGDVNVYDILHINDNGTRSIIIVSEEV